MKILVARTDCRFATTELKRGARYVCNDTLAHVVAQTSGAMISVCADATAYTRPWRGEELSGKTLIVYRPLGVGDEFLTARLCAVARERFHADKVQFAIWENHQAFWAHNVTPFEFLPTLIPWETWQAAHYHVCGERWWESLALADQPDVWDIMGSVCGIQFAPEERAPLVPVPPSDVLQKTLEAFAPWSQGRPILLWQLAASSKIRSYPIDLTHKAIARLVRETQAAIICIGHPSQVSAYDIAESARVAVYSGGIPGLISLVGVAAGSPRGVVVCPDSVLGHIVANYHNITAISLWAAFDPSRRIATYANHRPIFKRIKCSPCWSHEASGDPRRYQGCPLTACNDFCSGMRCIDPAEIVEAVKAVLP